MLSERDRREVVADVARDLNVVLSPDDPVFVAVAVNERVLERAADAVAGRLVRQLEEALRTREERLAAGVSRAVNEEIAWLTQGADKARGWVDRTGKGWALGLLVLGVAEAVAIWVLSRGG